MGFWGFGAESDGRQIPILQLYPEIDYRAADRGAMRGTYYRAAGRPGQADCRARVRDRGHQPRDGLPPASGHVRRMDDPVPFQIRHLPPPSTRMRGGFFMLILRSRQPRPSLPVPA